MGSGKVCFSLGIVLNFIYARWKIHCWLSLGSVIVDGVLPFCGIPYGMTPRIPQYNFNQDPFLKVFVCSCLKKKKKSQMFFSISTTSKIALYPKVRINFILKRNGELCHSGHLWLCLHIMPILLRTAVPLLPWGSHPRSAHDSALFVTFACSRDSVWVFICMYICLL